MSSNNIIRSLGLTPISMDDKKLLAAPQTASADDEAENDIQTARDGLYRALDASRQVVEDMASIAQQSQHPKAYEVLNSAIKTLADISSELGTIQLKKQRLQRRGDSEEGHVTNNNLFVGTTAELQQLLDDMRNKKDDEE